MDRRSFDIMMRKLGRSRSSNATLELPPIIDASRAISACSLYRKSRARVVQSIRKRVEKITPVTLPPRVSPIPGKSEVNMAKFAKRCKVTEMSRFLEKDIRKRIKARSLESKYTKFLDLIMSEVRADYLSINRYMSVKTKTKLPPDEQLDIKITPYKFLGKTDRYPEYLRVRKILKKKWILHYSLLRNILKNCVTKLPYVLIKLPAQQPCPFKIDEFEDAINKEIKDASLFLRDFYRTIVQLIEEDVVSIHTEKLHRYYGACTGLFTLHLSRSIAHTILHIVDFTSCDKLVPYLMLSVSFDKTAMLYPTSEEVSDMYTNFISNLLDMGNQFYVLQRVKLNGYSSKRITLYITETFIEDCKTKIKRNIIEAFKSVSDYVNSLNSQFEEIYEDVSCAENKLFSDIIFAEGHEKIIHYKNFMLKVFNIPSKQYFQIGYVMMKRYTKRITSGLKLLADNIFQKLALQHLYEVNDINEIFSMISYRAHKNPKTTEELIEIVKYMAWVKEEFLEQLTERVYTALGDMVKLITLGPLSDNHMHLNCCIKRWLDKIQPILDQNYQTFDQLKFEAEENLQRVIEEVNDDVTNVYPLLDILNDMDDISLVKSYLSHIISHVMMIKDIETKIGWINQEEICLSFPKSTYKEYESLKNYVYPFYHLLKLCLKVKQSLYVWQNGQFEILCHDATIKQLREYESELQNIQKTYRNKFRKSQEDTSEIKFKGTVDDPDILNWPAPLKLCHTALQSIEKFKPSLEIMKIMCNPTIKKRHWVEMSKIAGFNVQPDAGTTLKKLMDIDYGPELTKYETISIYATREAELLKQLENMKTEWRHVDFKIEMDANVLCNKLVDFEGIEDVMNGHMIQVSNMKKSVYVTPHKTKVEDFDIKLQTICKTIAECILVQDRWLQLVPIFSEQEIARDIQTCASEFSKADTLYKTYLSKVEISANVMTLAGTGEFLSGLTNCAQILDEVYTALCIHIETKRLYFPRLYFLTDDELITLISKVNNLLQVQLYINNLFPSISKLIFSGSEINGFESLEGETIVFDSTNTHSETRLVEKLLKNFENMMVREISQLILKSLENYPTEDLKAWIQHWPGHISAIIIKLVWTSKIHSCIGKQSIAQLLQEAENVITQISEIMLSTDQSFLMRVKLKTLIIICIHTRNVVNELITQKVGDENNFLWIGQLRYYLNEDNCEVKLLNASFVYGNEYVDNSGRLIMTALTERCYRTVFSAFHTHLYASPIGPAGTGKTETVKDLAKSLGVLCIVFSCSNSLDYATVARFIKGTASSGAWLALDEFNRITTEILSAIYQTIYSLQLAIKSKMPTLTIDKSRLSLNRNCFICTTMNPGYPGRSELPENLKSLFRNVAMMVPDSLKISEVSLISFGYVKAKEISLKLVATFKFMAEMFSSEKHYDFGIRTLKAVLSKCDALKRTCVDIDEILLVSRAIRETVTPRVIYEDKILFEEILADMFASGTDETFSDVLSKELATACCKNFGIYLNDALFNKMQQVYSTLMSRKGVIVVGDVASGKSTVIKMLAQILSDTDNNILVSCNIINPKTMTLEQMYGQYDTTLQRWRDGVLTKYIRGGAEIIKNTPQWIIFDGPIDTVWVENLNSVLDDNQKLCLCSGETVDVNDNISLIFETIDLKSASPATVSRCGVTYTEIDVVSWKWILESWLEDCDQTWCKQNSNYIGPLFNWLIPASLGTISTLTHSFKMTATNLVRTFLRLFETFVFDAIQLNTLKDDEWKNIRSWIQASAIQACFYSFTCTLDQDSMSKFDELFRTIWKGQSSTYPYIGNIDKMDVGMPPDNTVYESSYIYKQKGAWKNWSDLIKAEKISENILNQEILVPTVSLTKYTHLLNIHIRNKIPILFIGPSGCGKTSYMQEYLISNLDTLKHESSSLSITFNMTPNDVQNKILAKLRKIKSDLYGPSAGKSFVLFIDDLNVTKADEYGAKTVMELLRQHLDHNVWYNLHSLTPLKLADVTFLKTFTLRGATDADCTRLLRHFAIFAATEFSHDVRFKIYSSFLLYQWRKSGFPADVGTAVNQIVHATNYFYESISKHLKQTIDAPLYNFNMFDFNKAIKGFVLLKKETADTDKKVFAKLWVYEMLRVFGDRIISSNDRQWLADCISITVKQHFHEDVARILSIASPNEETEDEIPAATFETLSKIMFLSKNNDDKETQVLDEISLASFEEMLKSLLVEYNENHDSKLNIVLFEHFIMNVMKIAHKLATPKRNAMIIGMSSVGRKTACVVACELMKQKLHEPVMLEKFSHEDWRKQVKEALIDSGARMLRCVLLVDAFRIEENFFLNDIDYILKANDVETIFDPVEQQNLLHVTRSYVLQEKINLDMSAPSVFLYFNKHCKENLHVLVCLSLFSTNIQNIFQRYPSFSKFCDKIVFEDWPYEGFHAVAKCWLSHVKLEQNIKAKVIDGFQLLHKYSVTISNQFRKQHGIRNFVTNVAFLEVVKMYVKIITIKQNDLTTLKKRYTIGLDKLSFASVQIAKMQQSLADYQPKLKEMTERAKRMMEQIALETVEIERIKDLVKIDEEVANEQAVAANILKLDCEAELAQAIPILEDAISALNTLKPTDITLVKSMKNPPDAIKLVMAAVCVIKDVKPDRIPDPSTGRKTLDYWGPSKRILGDMNFLQTLKDFDKNNIKPEIMVKIRKEYLPHKDFQPHVVAKASSAAEGLCKWIIAMDMYDKVAKEVAPKKEKLEKAEAEYAQTLAILNEKKEEVARLERKLADLNSTLKEAEKQQQILQREVDLCNKRLKRAQRLISGLGGEKERWTNVSDKLQEHLDNLAGDILISCAIIAYLAPFPREVREEAIASWHTSIKQFQIPSSSDFDFTQVLGSETAVQKWHINQLPQDKFFVEDAIIHQYSSRWPLFVDPQFLARQWIKVTEKRNDLRVVTISDTNMLQIIKTSMQLGNAVIIEGVKQELDPCLEQVLFNNTARDRRSEPLETSQECSKGFRLYFLSHIKKPQYSPEIFCRVQIINFSLTKNSLAGILLNSITEIETPKIKLQENLLDVEMMENGNHLKATEEKILQTLSDSKADILEDELALKILDESKNFSNEVRHKQELVKLKVMKVKEIKKNYTKLAGHISVVFETICELHKVNFMYQYSLTWFLNILIDSIRTAEISNVREKRSKILKQKITYDVYTHVMRSLHVKHRMAFAFLLCIKLNIYYKFVASNELEFFLDECKINNHSDENKSLAKHSMRKIMQMVELDPIFDDFSQSIMKDITPFHAFITDRRFPDCELPFEWYKLLSPFKKVLIKSTLRPDKTFAVISQYVGDQLGDKYIEPVHFSLSLSYNQSNALCPLIFLLSRDTSDPMTLLLKFAKLKNMSHKLHTVSLGTGQGVKAKQIVLEGRKEGYWICLQNCHLATDWMTELKVILDQYNYENTHENFRLWLTTCESNNFPVSFLQNGIKMVNEAPPAVRENILRTYTRHPLNDASFFAGCPGKDDQFHRLLFSVALFHAIIEERREFGPIGWNIPYQFRHTDFHLAVKHLQKFLIQYEDPFDALQYLIGECDYGGRVSDDWDQRLVNVMLKDFLNATVSETNSYVFYENYSLPKKNDYADYFSQISMMPDKDHPELFGLHLNMDDLKLSNKSANTIETMKRFVSHSIDTRSPTCYTIQPIVTSIKSLLPDFECQKSSSPNSTQIILAREVQFYEILHQNIISHLQRITDFINGQSASSDEIDEIINSLIVYEVPKAWVKISYPTVSNLSGYIEDLSRRLTHISEWSKELNYNNIWFPVLNFPSGYLAMLKRQFSTSKSIPLEHVKLSFNIGATPSCSSDEIVIYGLYIEGACWNQEKSCLDEMRPGLTWDRMPSIILDGVHSSKVVTENKCKVPVYRLFTRRGVISTSGHSTNYIFPILLNTDKPSDHWVKRGVALLCQIKT